MEVCGIIVWHDDPATLDTISEREVMSVLTDQVALSPSDYTGLRDAALDRVRSLFSRIEERRSDGDGSAVESKGRAGKRGGEGGGGCPNRFNPHHTCNKFCLQKWGEAGEGGATPLHIASERGLLGVGGDVGGEEGGKRSIFTPPTSDGSVGGSGGGVSGDRAAVAEAKAVALVADGGGEGASDKLALIKVCLPLGSGDVDDARALIAGGINVDETDVEKNTALIWAAKYGRISGRVELVKELIRAGADLELKNSNKKTALKIALAEGQDCADIAIALLNGGARCPKYQRSGWIVSTCVTCGDYEDSDRHKKGWKNTATESSAAAVTPAGVPTRNVVHVVTPS